jgi:hypothetical protein
MKTARKTNSYFILLTIISLIFISCNRNNNIKELVQKNIPVIDYDKDTVVYRIDVKDDNIEKRNNETFYVVRNLYANNISLGSYSQEKEHSVFNIYRSNDTINLYLKFSVFIKEKNRLLKLWDIDTPNTDNIEYPILEQGATVNEHKKKNDLKSVYTYRYNILRIKSKRDAYPDFECLNFRLNKDNSWALISKEKLNTTIPPINGYCIDTISKNLNYLVKKQKNIIIFHHAFDSANKTWYCIK